MKIIDDKNVGELWRRALLEEGSYSAQTEMDLIRKLVEERQGKGWSLETILEGFGIPLATWPKE